MYAAKRAVLTFFFRIKNHVEHIKIIRKLHPMRLKFTLMEVKIHLRDNANISYCTYQGKLSVKSILYYTTWQQLQKKKTSTILHRTVKESETFYIFDEETYTVKRVDEVVRHPHLVTQDQFTQVSKKVSDIP
jgi:hypothetical protein